MTKFVVTMNMLRQDLHLHIDAASIVRG